ncbi:hypothetical protein ABEB36_012725 [Hypothenemus hampei]|uniref:Uncharacterized protein n=1 Tax=Hypothenemus hampei TaxID=57062 RepID=A0ABD1EC97_HYPHA
MTSSGSSSFSLRETSSMEINYTDSTASSLTDLDFSTPRETFKRENGETKCFWKKFLMSSVKIDKKSEVSSMNSDSSFYKCIDDKKRHDSKSKSLLDNLTICLWKCSFGCQELPTSPKKCS